MASTTQGVGQFISSMLEQTMSTAQSLRTGHHDETRTARKVANEVRYVENLLDQHPPHRATSERLPAHARQGKPRYNKTSIYRGGCKLNETAACCQRMLLSVPASQEVPKPSQRSVHSLMLVLPQMPMQLMPIQIYVSAHSHNKTVHFG